MYVRVGLAEVQLSLLQPLLLRVHPQLLPRRPIPLVWMIRTGFSIRQLDLSDIIWQSLLYTYIHTYIHKSIRTMHTGSVWGRAAPSSASATRSPQGLGGRCGEVHQHVWRQPSDRLRLGTLGNINRRLPSVLSKSVSFLRSVIFYISVSFENSSTNIQKAEKSLAER